MIYCGVDPGRHGAIARLNDLGPFPVVLPMPLTAIGGRTRYDLAAIRDSIPGADFLMVELPPVMPRAGIFAARAAGFSEGMWSALAVAHGIPYEFVLAKRWQAAMLDGTPPGKTKARAEQVVRRLWADLVLPKSRLEREGWCDALLIAEYARRTLGR